MGPNGQTPRSARALRRPIAVFVGLLATSLAAPSPASAQPSASAPSPLRRVGAVAAAAVPGLVVHGAGHWVLGEGAAARRLFVVGTTGAALAAVGGLAYLYSGASRSVAGLSMGVGFSGLALFGLSWIADLQGSLAPGGLPGAALRRVPWLQAETGYLVVLDPQFGTRHVWTLGAELRWRGLRLAPSFSAALRGEDWQARLLAAWRFLGPRPAPSGVAADGSFLDLEGAASWRADEDGGFLRGIGELFLRGRLDLARVGPTLRGTFAELGLGAAFTATTPTGIGRDAWDLSSMMLLRVGYGVYLGRPGGRHAEIMAYYDHRHDGYAAGMLWGGLVTGTAGKFGLIGTVRLGSRWGLSAEAQLGSAFTAHLRAIYQVGDLR